MKVIITGATGMVGKIVLRECLNSPKIEKVVVLTRRSTGQTHSKLEEIIHQDFTNYDGLSAHFENLTAAYFCIGVYTGTVPDDKFKMITVDYNNAFADAVKKNSPKATFCLLSGQGADQTEKSQVSFAKYKGMAENYLISKGFNQLYIFRPGYIYPVEPRQEPNLMYKIFRFLYPVINRISPAMSITSEQLGKAIFKAGIEGTSMTVLENEDIKKV